MINWFINNKFQIDIISGIVAFITAATGIYFKDTFFESDATGKKHLTFWGKFTWVLLIISTAIQFCIKFIDFKKENIAKQEEEARIKEEQKKFNEQDSLLKVNFKSQIDRLTLLNDELTDFSSKYEQDNKGINENFNQNIRKLENTEKKLGHAIVQSGFPLAPLRVGISFKYKLPEIESSKKLITLLENEMAKTSKGYLKKEEFKEIISSFYDDDLFYFKALFLKTNSEELIFEKGTNTQPEKYIAYNLSDENSVYKILKSGGLIYILEVLDSYAYIGSKSGNINSLNDILEFRMKFTKGYRTEIQDSQLPAVQGNLILTFDKQMPFQIKNFESTIKRTGKETDNVHWTEINIQSAKWSKQNTLRALTPYLDDMD